jgi:hypothetical protein
VPNPEQFIREIFRVLVPGGTVIISTPDTHLYSPGGEKHNLYHCSEMTTQQFRALLGSTFAKTRLFGQRPVNARWWSPMCLISESCPWERLPRLRGIRRRLWARWNPEWLTLVSESDRDNPVKLISGGEDSWLRRAVRWSAVRPIWRSKGWSPMYLVAVAQKESR